MDSLLLLGHLKLKGGSCSEMSAGGYLNINPQFVISLKAGVFINADMRISYIITVIPSIDMFVV
jgi:hypothetical protein